MRRKEKDNMPDIIYKKRNKSLDVRHVFHNLQHKPIFLFNFFYQEFSLNFLLLFLLKEIEK